MSQSASRHFSRLRLIPRGIWVLGFVSMLMDVSSEIIHALLPLYLVGTLGASIMTVGLIEGTAEAIVSIAKVFSGTLSDMIGKRKGLTALGYGLAALTKPVFPLASNIAWVMAARFTDRIGKGIREAPRDALIADLVAPDLRGASFGLRQSLDTAGALVGPLIAVLLMMLLAGNIRAVFWFAALPALMAFALVVLGVKEPAQQNEQSENRTPVNWRELAHLGARFWWVAALGAVFTLARFSEAFLVLRMQSLGFSPTFTPLIMAVMSFTYAFSAYPAGAWSDRAGRIPVLLCGMAVLCGSDLVLAFAPNAFWVMAGAGLWGVHMGLTQGLFAALIADAAPASLRGTAFGLFNLVGGGAVLLASLIAGTVWQIFGPAETFLTSGFFALIALAGTALLRARLPG